MANPTPNEVNEATAPAAEDQTPNEAPEAEEVDLAKLTREELNAYAIEHGIDEAERFPNKGQLIEALETGSWATFDVEAEDEVEPDVEPMRFRVLKAVTLDDGRTVMPGEALEIAADDPSWPARRPKQLVGQKYLRPMNDAAKDATRGSDDDA